MRKLVLISCLILLFLFFSVGLASAKTWYVDDSRSANFTTIQDAVNNASVMDTIIIRDGCYYENINVNKQLMIESENGSENCIVDARSSGSPFTLSADGITIEGFTLRNSGEAGIKVYSSNNKISGNNILSSGDSICLYHSSNNIISGNNISNNEGGIILSESSNNKISRNEILNNTGEGIHLHDSNSNNILGNNILNNYGIGLGYSHNNTISGNNISNNNGYGIHFRYSNNNTISNNTFSNAGFFVWYSYSNIASNNTVNGKPLVYLENEKNVKVDYAGQVILVNCNSITIQNQNLSNTSVGIELFKTLNCIISGNDVSNSSDGIFIYNSSNNTFLKNNILNNNEYGIRLQYSNNNKISGNEISNNKHRGIGLSYSSNNKIYLNNFINNTNNVYSYNSTNIWDSTSEINYTYNGKTFTNYLGNYWDDYKGLDATEDGIGDTPYSIDSDESNYPLIRPFENYAIKEAIKRPETQTEEKTIPETTTEKKGISGFEGIFTIAGLLAIAYLLRRSKR